MAYNNNQFNDIEISSYSPPLIDSYSSNSGISPTILIAIIVTAAVSFVLGLLQLVVRYFRQKLNPSICDVEAYGRNGPSNDARALRRQLQQLFRLHDSGLDHTFLDAHPVFYYKDIVCLDTRPRPSCFDCAVCLSVFFDGDRLRLLPGCGHAFHLNCIDAWLLSNSTCPLCHSSLVDSAAHQVEASDGSNDEFGMEEGARAEIKRRVFSFSHSREVPEIGGRCRGDGMWFRWQEVLLDGILSARPGRFEYNCLFARKLSPAARNSNGATGNGKFKAAGNEEDKRSDGGRPRAGAFPCPKSGFGLGTVSFLSSILPYPSRFSSSSRGVRSTSSGVFRLMGETFNYDVVLDI